MKNDEFPPTHPKKGGLGEHSGSWLMTTKLEKNAAGRIVPVEVNGREGVPFKGVGKHRPEGRKAAPRVASCIDFPTGGDKRAASLREALEQVGLSDGMVVSTHHHLRNGDAVGNLIFDAAAEIGAKDLMWFPSASFPVHANQIGHLDSGVIHHIEGSMNGPLGAYCSAGKMRTEAVGRRSRMARSTSMSR
jgi:citrate lyase subunit alpha/citrate CoA-transferase